MLQRRTLKKLFSSNKERIIYSDGRPYNQRWQWKWAHGYYAYPRFNEEHTQTKTPEDNAITPPVFASWYFDWTQRIIPAWSHAWSRRHRMTDAFQMTVLPSTSLFFYMFHDLSFGFKWLSFLPWAVFYLRFRDKTFDPDMKETYLREMLYSNPEISELFKEETIHVMDYNFEYDQGFPDAEDFPEFNNKYFRFFNVDTSMCSGHFTFGDVASGATMDLKIRTMPIAGKSRYMVGEPFFFYDVVAEINHNGVYKEVVLVDKEESLKRYRPFLFWL